MADPKDIASILPGHLPNIITGDDPLMTLIRDVDKHYQQVYKLFPTGVRGSPEEFGAIVAYERSYMSSLMGRGNQGSKARINFMLQHILESDLKYLTGLLAQEHNKDARVMATIRAALQRDEVALRKEVSVLFAELHAARDIILSDAKTTSNQIALYSSKSDRKKLLDTIDIFDANLDRITGTIAAHAEEIDKWIRTVGSLGAPPSPTDVDGRARERIAVLRAKLKDLDKGVPAKQLLSEVADSTDSVVFGWNHSEVESQTPFLEGAFSLLKTHGYHWLALELPRDMQFYIDNSNDHDPESVVDLDKALIGIGVVQPEAMVDIIMAAKRKGIEPVAADTNFGLTNARTEAEISYELGARVPYEAGIIRELISRKSGGVIGLFGGRHDAVDANFGRDATDRRLGMVTIDLVDGPGGGPRVIQPGVAVAPGQGRLSPSPLDQAGHSTATLVINPLGYPK